MTNLIERLTSAATNIVLFAAAIIMTGLSFAFVGTLALFALMALGVAMIASPLAARTMPADADA